MGLLTKGIGAAIKGFKPAKNLTKRRADFEDIVKGVDKHGKSSKASKIKYDAAKKLSGIHDKWEKAKATAKKAKSAQTKKAVGAAVGAGAAATGVHGAAKHKFPKYKKWMERDIKKVDGKLKLVPKKKETKLPEGFVKIKD